MSAELIRWIVLTVSLWLPLQGYATPFMPFCQHQQTQSVEATSCHAQHTEDTDGSDPGRSGLDCNCDGCALCHLASSTAPIIHPPMWSALTHGVDLPLYTNFYRSHIPEQPRRPPLLLIS